MNVEGTIEIRMLHWQQPMAINPNYKSSDTTIISMNLVSIMGPFRFSYHYIINSHWAHYYSREDATCLLLKNIVYKQ